MSSKSPNTNPNVELDGGATVRKAFLVEAILNLFTIPLLTNTRTTLSFLLNDPAHINPSTILFARLFGGVVVGGLTSALLAGYANTRNGIESRRVVYLMLGLGEVMLIPVLGIEATKGGSRDAAVNVKVAVASVMCLAPPLFWRIYVLFVRPDMLGRYREARKD